MGYDHCSEPEEPEEVGLPVPQVVLRQHSHVSSLVAAHCPSVGAQGQDADDLVELLVVVDDDSEAVDGHDEVLKGESERRAPEFPGEVAFKQEGGFKREQVNCDDGAFF